MKLCIEIHDIICNKVHRAQKTNGEQGNEPESVPVVTSPSAKTGCNCPEASLLDTARNQPFRS